MSTLSSLALQRAEIEIPYRRLWTGLFSLLDDALPAKGDRATIVIGSLTLVGTVIDSGSFGGSASVRVVGGMGGWRKAPTGLSFQNDANLTTLDVASALAATVGETLVDDVAPLGVNWSFDPSTSAGRNLDAIGDWYMREDGVTVLGTRQDGAEVKAVVENFEPTRGRATCLVEEADVASFLPGALVSSEALTASIRVKHTRILMSANRLAIEVSDREQTPARIAQNVGAGQRFLGTYIYRVIEEIDDRLQLQVVDQTKGLPDQPLVPKAHGLPGVVTDCAFGGEVLVVFADGDRSRPYVSAYLGASTETRLVAPSIVLTSSAALPAPEPIALAPAVDSIKTALLAFCTTINAAPDAAAAALLLKGATGTLASALSPITRTGSVVAEAQ